MSRAGNVDRLLREARGVRDRLKEKGLNYEAGIVQQLIRSRESSRELNSVLHRENAELRGTSQ